MKQDTLIKELEIKAELCEFYETGLRKGLSSATLKNYGFYLKRFFTSVTSYTVPEAIGWYNEVKDSKPSTKNTFYSALRFYFEEVKKFEIPRPGAKSEPREKISFKQISKVLKSDEASLRDQLIFLLSFMEISVKEIARMRNDEFIWFLPRLRKAITLNKLLISDFESLLLIQEAESYSKNTKFLFPSRINIGKHISERTVQSIIQKMNLL